MLAEITIPHIWSFRAVLSLIGIVYMLICFCIIAVKGFHGWAFVLTLACIGLLLLTMVTADPLKNYSDGSELFNYRVYIADGKTTIDEKTAIHSNKWYQEEPRIYAMHDPQAEYCITISPWVFHPACLVWSPGIAAIIFAGMFFTGSNKS